MKKQKGFIVPLLIIIIAALAIGSGVYIHNQNKKSVEQNAAFNLTASSSDNIVENDISSSSVSVNTNVKLNVSYSEMVHNYLFLQMEKPLIL